MTKLQIHEGGVITRPKQGKKQHKRASLSRWPRIDDFGCRYILPHGTRYVSDYNDGIELVVEIAPRIYNVKWDAWYGYADEVGNAPPHLMHRKIIKHSVNGYKYINYRLSVPYFVLLFKLSRNNGKIHFYGGRALFWNTKPLESLDDKLMPVMFPNTNIGVCLGGNLNCTHDSGDALILAVDDFLHHYYGMGFNDDMNGDENFFNYFEESYGINTPLDWEEATIEDPSFILRPKPIDFGDLRTIRNHLQVRYGWSDNSLYERMLRELTSHKHR